MPRILAALLIGLLFGVGLTVSQMINPAKVLGFLDVAGDWDPSLALVMAGALVVTFVGYRIVLAGRAPLLAESFQLPTKRDLDLPLIGGAAIFGIGWGLAGLCPGPAITAIGLGERDIVLFVIAMVGGMGAHHLAGARLRAA
ncbi:MAG: DUF6691 family protein [Alphaproteobacteria bacterium]